MVDRINTPGTPRVSPQSILGSSKPTRQTRPAAGSGSTDDEAIDKEKERLRREREQKKEAAARAAATSTTTTIPRDTTEAAEVAAGGIKPPDLDLSDELDRQILEESSKLVGLGYSSLQIQAAKEGLSLDEYAKKYNISLPKEEEEGFWETTLKAVGKNALLNIFMPGYGALVASDVPRRAIIGGAYELGELAPGRKLKFTTQTEILEYERENPDSKGKYKVGDTIPTSKARFQDYWKNLNRAETGFGELFARQGRYLPFIGESLAPEYTQEDFDIAQAEYNAGILKEPPQFKPGDKKPGYVAGASTTGSKWADRTIGLVGDIAFDPVTYLTLGTGTAAKLGVKGGAKLLMPFGDDVARLFTRELTELAAKKVADKGAKVAAKEVEKAILKKFADELPDVAAPAGKELTRFVRALTAEGAQEAVEAAANPAALATAQRELTKATRAWSSVAPARQYGARNREVLANELLKLRDEAAVVANMPPRSTGALRDVEQRVAQKFVDAMTDEVIQDIARRGPAAFTPEVIDALGISGRARWGIGRFRRTVIGSEDISRGLAVAGSGVRSTFAKVVPDVFTSFGRPGLVGTEAILDARLGLKRGNLSPKDAVKAVRLLAQDTVYKGFENSALRVFNSRLKKILNNSNYRRYTNTVYQLLEVSDNVLSQGRAAVERALGRPVNVYEYAFAAELKRFMADANIALRRAYEESFVPPGIFPAIDTPKSKVNFLDSKYPLVLSDKAIDWLLKNKGKKEVQDLLLMLGLKPHELAAGVRVPNKIPVAGLAIGDVTLGTLRRAMPAERVALTQVPLLSGTVSLADLNKFANDLGFKGEFFGTNISTVLENWAQKYARDYAFMKLLSYYTGFGNWGQAVPGSPFVRGIPGMQKFYPSEDKRNFLIDLINVPELKFPGSPLTDISGLVKQRQHFSDRIQDLMFAIENQARKYSGSPEYENITAAYSQMYDDLLEINRQMDFILGDIIRLAGDWDLSGAELSRMTGMPFDPRIVDSVELILNQMRGLLANYRAVLELDPAQLNKVMDNLGDNPRILTETMNLLDEAYILFDKSIVPDVYVRAEVASMYNNLNNVLSPGRMSPVLNLIKKFNQTTKAWVTAYPGYHVVNFIGNMFAVLAGGAKPKNLTVGLGIQSDFLGFLRKSFSTYTQEAMKIDKRTFPTVLGSVAEQGLLEQRQQQSLLEKAPLVGDIARGLPDFDTLFDEFMQSPAAKKYKPSDLESFREALKSVGAGGLGDIAEIFAATTRQIGYTGRETTGRETKRRISKVIGAPLRWSKKTGDVMEDFFRVIFTYDGIKEGLTPAQSAARTNRFLIDYGDASVADNFIKQFYLFWMWPSRAIPVQLVNMITNPKLYQQYQAVRRNFEDEETGKNVLLPEYLRKAGAFAIGTRGGIPYAARPDLGFPGTGGQNPMLEGLGSLYSIPTGGKEVPSPKDIIKGAVGPLTSIIRVPTELAMGEKAFSGEPIEGWSEAIPYLVSQAVPAFPSLGRFANLFAAGQFEGEFGNVLRGLFGITKGQEGVDNELLRQRALAQYLRSPIVPITPVEERTAKFDILDLLRRMQEQGRQ